jgi:hypothetical protein
MMESRHFDQGRVIVARNELKDQNEIKLPPAPPRGSPQRDNGGEPRVLRGEDFKPTQGPPARELKLERSELARRIEAPVVERKASLNVDRPTGVDRNAPNRGAAGESTGAAPARGASDRTVPSRGDASAPARVQDGQIIRTERPARSTDYQPVERIPAPARKASDDSGLPVDRNLPSRNTGDSPRSLPPTRDADHPRSETPQRNDPAPPRTEVPRRYDPPPKHESAPQRTEAPRRPDPSPPRESAPQRAERPSSPPSSPPPARESAPAKSESRPERPAPPSREKP